MLRLYNVLTRKKEIFKPLRGTRVGLYTCGPTVYSSAHIGNLRTYIFEDVLRRSLEYAGYKVRQVMNITDVEDKIIRDARKSNTDIYSFTAPYERAFFEDLGKLGILPAWKYPKATAHISEMIKIISLLVKRGLAYESAGSVYFDISKFKTYGKLSGLKTRSLKAGAGSRFASPRVDSDEYGKDDAHDFVLWKAERAGEPSWQAPFGAGRPGWHIECSAMSMKYLGKSFDIHAGGVDLIFPHHENEIAQSEGATGKKFVRYFVEGEHLLVNGEKMSKSLGNVFTLRDIEARGVNPLAFRYLCLTAHYRAQLNFSWESLVASQNSLRRLQEFIAVLLKSHFNSYRSETSIENSFDAYKKRFEDAIFDDLNTPKALAVVWDLVAAYHKNPRLYPPRATLHTLYEFDRILGLGLKSIKQQKIPKKVLALAKKREDLRRQKNWAAADRIRDEITRLGWGVKDIPEGSSIHRLE